MDNPQQSPFGILPAYVMGDQSLTSSEKYFLAVLASWADQDGQCWPSIKTIAVRAGISARRVNMILARLKETGYITVTPRTGNDGEQQSNLYTLTWIANAWRGMKTTSPPPEAVVTHPPEEGFTQNRPVGIDQEESISVKATENGDHAFDEFWSLYPKRVAKGQARRAYKAAKRKVGQERILATLELALPDLTQRDRTFVPHPATWLNAEPWEDEDAQDETTRRIASARRLLDHAGRESALLYCEEFGLDPEVLE